MKVIICYEFNNLYIPNTLINLKSLYCDNTQIKKPNNKKYLTFTRCQKNYKYKICFAKLTNLTFDAFAEQIDNVSLRVQCFAEIVARCCH